MFGNNYVNYTIARIGFCSGLREAHSLLRPNEVNNNNFIFWFYINVFTIK